MFKKPFGKRLSSLFTNTLYRSCVLGQLAFAVILIGFGCKMQDWGKRKINVHTFNILNYQNIFLMSELANFVG